MVDLAAWPGLLARTYDVVRVPVALLGEPLLDRPTPCGEWTVSNLFEHTVTTLDRFASALGSPACDPVTGTPVERFDAAVARNLAAWGSVTDPEAAVTLPFGSFPAHLAVAMNQLDSLVHGWDLAAALGIPLPMPEDLAEVALQTAEIRCRREPRAPAWGPEVPPRGDSTQEKLLALTGRDTAAWPGGIWVAGSLVTVKPTSGGAGTASGVEIWEREGSGPPRHVHADHDELWYVLEGRFTFSLGEREFQAGEGDVVVGPRGVPHAFRAETARSRLLDVHMPGGFERFFVQAGRPADDLVPPPGADPEGIPELRAAIESFGAAVVGPPLGI
jgi:uncharacterized protein (TIGR03086 family)